MCISIRNTASHYHLIHSLCILVSPVIIPSHISSNNYAAKLFTLGITLFSGSLYTLVLTNNRKFGAITPSK
jgi:uncharacterized membrane protein YgdD (TMEM256/DUF423 family)